MRPSDIFSFKHLFIKKNKSNRQITYKLIINDQEIEKWKVISNRHILATMSDLRSFKSPQFETGYVLRRKKAYQTYLFQQNYDVIISDPKGKILDLHIDLGSSQKSKYYKDAHFVYFFPVGTIKFFDLKLNDMLIIRAKYLSH